MFYSRKTWTKHNSLFLVDGLWKYNYVKTNPKRNINDGVSSALLFIFKKICFWIYMLGVYHKMNLYSKKLLYADLVLIKLLNESVIYIFYYTKFLNLIFFILYKISSWQSTNTLLILKMLVNTVSQNFPTKVKFLFYI